MHVVLNTFVYMYMYNVGGNPLYYQLILDGWGLESTIYLHRRTTNRKVRI